MENDNVEKRINEARRLMFNLKSSIEGLDNENKKRMDGINQMVKQLSELLNKENAASINYAVVSEAKHLNNEKEEVKQYLIQNFKTFEDFGRWRRRCEDDYSASSAIKKKTGHMITMSILNELAKSSLPSEEVKE